MTMDKEKILIELEEKIKNKELIKIIFSSKISGDFEKVIVKPIILKNGAFITDPRKRYFICQEKRIFFE